MLNHQRVYPFVDSMFPIWMASLDILMYTILQSEFTVLVTHPHEMVGVILPMFQTIRMSIVSTWNISIKSPWYNFKKCHSFCCGRIEDMPAVAFLKVVSPVNGWTMVVKLLRFVVELSIVSQCNYPLVMTNSLLLKMAQSKSLICPSKMVDLSIVFCDR